MSTKEKKNLGPEHTRELIGDLLEGTSKVDGELQLAKGADARVAKKFEKLATRTDHRTNGAKHLAVFAPKTC